MSAARWLLLAPLAGLLAPAEDPPSAPDFVHEVLPHLQRQGCASAYCHGAATGQGGFKLSLFGGEPERDHAAIAGELAGRRVDLADPDASLVLQKPLGRLRHGGGRRLDRDGAAHAALRAWLAAGAPFASGPARELVHLELVARDGGFGARAHFRAPGATQGAAATRDVSRLALWSTTDPTVVEVEPDGSVQVRGAGRAHVLARYGRLTARAAVEQPFRGAGRAPHAGAHPLDRAWLAHLGGLGLAPAPAVAPERLARRLYLDLVGRPPTPQELDAFVAAPDVAATVARLVARPEFAAVWGEHLARWFEVPGPDADRAGADAARLRAELVALLGRGEGLVHMAGRIATGELALVDRHEDPRDRAEHYARAVLGVRLGCARCHDHPQDRWRRADHQAFAALFARPRPDAGGGMAAGVLFDPDTGAAVRARLLPDEGALVGAAVDGEAPRAALARDLAGAGRARLARNAANRVFALLLGRGLVEPVDDHRLGNPPLDEAMLAVLAGEFERAGGRLAPLLAFVTTSRLYAAGLAEDAAGERWLAGRASRPLAPETYARAVTAVLGPGVAAVPAGPLARALALRNGPWLREALERGGTTVDALHTLGTTPEERLRELWRTVLSRAPRPAELERFLPAAGADLDAYRDLAFALFAGREFGHLR
ncbi:MAG: DUF1549 domain-containing protein [Planctomycetes bacterium]|nr:DUF1549 domain-containing protein [Planctomycetota bacterium]